MHTTSQQDHKQRINRVINHIQSNLDQPMHLEELASLACYSPFHFHRIFTACIGEPLFVYVKRLRMERAISKLCYTDIPVTDIAFNAGYENHSSFCKAFKQQWGIPPSAFRKKGISPPSSPAAHTRLNTSSRGQDMEFVIIIRKTTKVIYTRKTGSYDKAAREAWKTLCETALPKNLIDQDAEFIGISHDDPNITEPDKLRYDACITIQQDVKPEGEMGVQELAGGKHAVFTHKGPYEKLAECYNWIFSQWLQQTNHNLRDAHYLEKYLNDPDETDPTELLTEIWVPID